MSKIEIIIMVITGIAVAIPVIRWQINRMREKREEESIKETAKEAYPNDLFKRQEFERLLLFNRFHTKKRTEATKRGKPYPGNGLGIPDQYD